MALAPLVDEVLGGDIPLAVEAYDGSRAGPDRRRRRRSSCGHPDALRRLVTAPGELGFGPRLRRR